MKIKIFAPAKINLGLEILKRRTDGYHEVDMVMQSINLCDEIIVENIAADKIIVECDKDIGCSMEKNLAYKAAKIFLNHAHIQGAGFKIKIVKKIPQEAGLAGGSADAAAVLYALNIITNSNISKSDMINMASEIGSDVPFCLVGGCVQATGSGTQMRSISSLSNCFLVVVKPEISICTREAYALFDDFDISEFKNNNNLIKSLYESDINGISKNIFNRFEEIINNSEISLIKEKLRFNGALGAAMSGSGSAVFGIFKDKSTALKCLNKLEKNYKQVFLCEPIEHGVYVG